MRGAAWLLVGVMASAGCASLPVLSDESDCAPWMAWQTTLPPEAHRPPGTAWREYLSADGRLYVTSDGAPRVGRSYVLALAPEDGRILWSAGLEGVEPAYLDFWVRFEDMLLVTTQTAEPDSNPGPVYAFDAATGALRWTRAADPHGDQRLDPRAGSLFVVVEDTLVRVDPATGADLWSSREGSYVVASAFLVHDDVVAILYHDHAERTFGVRGHALDTGAELWSASWPGFGSGMDVRDGVLLVATSHSDVHALDPTTGAPVDAPAAPPAPEPAPPEPAPEPLPRGTLYYAGMDGDVVALAEDGSERWRAHVGLSKGRVTEWFSSKVSYQPVRLSPRADGVLVIQGNESGVLEHDGYTRYRLLDAADGHERWRSPKLYANSVRSNVSALVLEGTIGLPDELGARKLFALDLATGDVAWECRLGDIELDTHENATYASGPRTLGRLAL